MDVQEVRAEVGFGHGGPYLGPAEFRVSNGYSHAYQFYPGQSCSGRSDVGLDNREYVVAKIDQGHPSRVGNAGAFHLGDDVVDIIAYDETEELGITQG